VRAQVLGFYGKNNIGDEGFRPAIRNVVGAGVELDFADEVCSLEGYDALVVGGGSFLDQPLNISAAVGDVPLIFLGVGIHGAHVHPDTLPWLERARLVVARNETAFASHVGPDLLFARTDLQPTCAPEERRLLVLPNGFALPRQTSSVWELRAWERYETAMAEILGEMVRDGWSVRLQPMCAETILHSPHDDRLASARLFSVLSDTEGVEVGLRPLSEAEFVDEVSRSELVLSSRLHGCVYSALLGRPFVGVSAHDKLLSFFAENELANVVDLYTIAPDAIAKAIATMPSASRFRQLRVEGQEKWAHLSAIVRDALSS